MTGTRKLAVVALSLLMLCAVSAFAGTVKDLSKHMWTWAVMEELLDEAAHGGMPPISPVEAENTLLAAQAEIKTIVAGIKTADEMATARTLADDFVKMQGVHEIVGRSLHRLLDQQGKFLGAHRNDID